MGRFDCKATVTQGAMFCCYPWLFEVCMSVTEGAMFWGDSRLGRLETSRLDGSSRRVIYDHVGDRYYSIAVSPRYLYVTDWTERYDRHGSLT